MRRGKHESIRVRRAMITVASASGMQVPAIVWLVQAAHETTARKMSAWPAGTSLWLAFFACVSCSAACQSSYTCRQIAQTAKEAEGAVPDEDKKRAAHRALVDRVLNGEGRASAEQRARAFSNDGLSPPLDALIGKVADRPAQVTEEDLAAAKASGCTEDQLFELVICAAVGQSARLYEAGLAALAEATVKGRPDHAT